MALILKQYKFKNGEINFPAVFSIPSNERLPVLYEKDMFEATALVVGALTMAFKRMKLKKMDGELINDIAEEILDTCGEDNLSLEDLVLFLQYMVRGKYGNIDDITIAKFMTLFDKYRDERVEAITTLRENEHLQFKGLGNADRSYKEDSLSEHFSRFADTMSTLRENIKELKQQNK